MTGTAAGPTAVASSTKESGGECVLTTMLGAAIVGAPFLGVGVIVFWCAVFGWGGFWPVDVLVSLLLCFLGALAMFGASCMGRRGEGGAGQPPVAARWSRAWIVAAGVSGGLVLPLVIAQVIRPGGSTPGVATAAGLLGGWGILVTVALRKARRAVPEMGHLVAGGMWRIAMGAGARAPRSC